MTSTAEVQVNAEQAFAASYGEARHGFVAKARAAGARLSTYRHRAAGPAGEPLAMDVAQIGAAGPSAVLVVLSATHGVEGFAGSAIQQAWLATRPKLARGLAVILVHAVNPFGFAWLRRVNEDNVDVNRNFLDHTAAHPANPDYDMLHPALCPQRLTTATLTKAREAVGGFLATHGRAATFFALVAGQYRHADGLYFGGWRRSWSAAKLTAALRKRLAGARSVGLIDIHTGFGAYGEAELMGCPVGGTAGRALARDWFGDATSPADGSSEFVENFGDTANVLDWAAPAATRAAITLEFGTRPEEQVFGAVQADNWLHRHGRLDSARGREIKAAIRDAFYPDAADWRARVLDTGVSVLDRAAGRLAG
ncbi:MAG: M14 family metallopeptidase [Alphaproteobacteria bacterium]